VKGLRKVLACDFRLPLPHVGGVRPFWSDRAFARADQVNQRFSSPVIAIVNRWLRLGHLFARCLAKICSDFELIDRPLWVLITSFFLIYFLIETSYRWLEIHALSVSPIPLFPRFQVNASGEEWPTHPRLLKVRDWLRGQGFKQVQALKAEVGGGIYLRTSVYQDSLAQLRIQITFLPQANGGISVCYTLSSQTVSGYRYLTDNLYLPFGGFYPENWLVERNALASLLMPSSWRGTRTGLPVRMNCCALDRGAAGRPQHPAARAGAGEHRAGFPLSPGDREDHGKSPTKAVFASGKSCGCSTISVCRRVIVPETAEGAGRFVTLP
jgi:hypothetical protein